MKKLADGYEPGPFDVICARGKEAFMHRGNRSFRATLEYHLESYATAETKQQKSEIVSLVFNGIGEASPEGGFVRKNKNGEWCRVPDHVAREKIGQGFRDLLYTEYRSSTKAKIQRRRERLYSSGVDDEYPDEAQTGENQSQSDDRKQPSYTDTDPIPLEESIEPANVDILRQCSFSFANDERSQPSIAEVSPSFHSGSRHSHSLSGDSSAYSYYSPYNDSYYRHYYTGGHAYPYHSSPSWGSATSYPVHPPAPLPPPPERAGVNPYPYHYHSPLNPRRVNYFQTREASQQAGPFDSYDHDSQEPYTAPPPHQYWYGY